MGVRRMPKIGEGRENFQPETIEHWDLVVEALGRVLVHHDIPEERRPPWTPLDYRAYFVLAYHLVDFLEQHDGYSADSLKTFVRSQRNLSICRDLCMNVKHAVMTSAAYSPGGELLRLTPETATFDEGVVDGTFHRVLIEVESQQLDAAEVAVGAYFEWIEWGMPWQDHTKPVWDLAEPVATDNGVQTSVLRVPREPAWQRMRERGAQRP